MLQSERMKIYGKIFHDLKKKKTNENKQKTKQTKIIYKIKKSLISNNQYFLKPRKQLRNEKTNKVCWWPSSFDARSGVSYRFILHECFLAKYIHKST